MRADMTEFIVAESAVRQLHARYADAVWRKDVTAFGDCFTQDAEWRIVGMVLRGRDQIVSGFERLMSRYQRVLMQFQNPILTVGDKSAVGRTYVVEHRAAPNERPGMTIGTYFERFVDQGDRWRFAWRLYQLHYIGPPDLSGTFFDQPDYGPPPNMPPLDAPTYNLSGARTDNQ
jgi:uncharacterized protein (TIGR02246 family)